MQLALAQLRSVLFSPVSIASLVVARIAFGAVMLWEVCRYFSRDWIARYWIEPKFHFTYIGFDWVKPWPGDGMYYHMLALGVLSLFLMVGFLYRLSAVLFFFGFTYTFLLEQARYLNHFYLVCLLSFIFIFLPANRAMSIDAMLLPHLRSTTIPFWPVFLLRMQLGLVYFYGGIAKINADWLQGEPIRSWLAVHGGKPFIGALFTWEPFVYLIAYGGLLFDLLIAPALLYRRTQPFALVLMIGFHLTNAYIFKIGIFPWLAIALTTIFLDPAWPLRLMRYGATSPRQDKHTTYGRSRERGVVGFCLIYTFIQVIVPLRHFIYPGNVHWNEEGHLFAWHMKLRDKDSDIYFVVIDPLTRKSWREDPSDYLTGWQAAKMATRPEMIRQFSHYLARVKEAELGREVEVQARVFASLNGREPKLLVKPDVNLAKQGASIWPYPWVTSLTDGSAQGLSREGGS